MTTFHRLAMMAAVAALMMGCAVDADDGTDAKEEPDVQKLFAPVDEPTTEEQRHDAMMQRHDAMMQRHDIIMQRHDVIMH